MNNSFELGQTIGLTKQADPVVAEMLRQITAHTKAETVSKDFPGILSSLGSYAKKGLRWIDPELANTGLSDKGLAQAILGGSGGYALYSKSKPEDANLAQQLMTAGYDPRILR